MGGRAKRDAVLKGADPIAVHNQNSDPLYRVGRVVDVGRDGWQTIARPDRDLVGEVLMGRQPVDNGGVKDAYQIAKDGGKHSGMLRNYANRPTVMIERGAGAMNSQIALHEGWIKDPFSKLPSTIDKRELDHLVNVKWPRDIARLREESGVLRGLIEERQNEQQ